jgi:hypothetical protein
MTTLKQIAPTAATLQRAPARQLKKANSGPDAMRYVMG